MASRLVVAFVLGRVALAGHSACADLSCKAPPSPTLPLHDPRLTQRLGASGDPLVAEQVRLIGGPPTKVGVVWAGPLEASGVGIEYCLSSTAHADHCARPEFWPAGRPWTYSSLDGFSHPGCPDLTGGVACCYESPAFFAAELSGLAPGSSYLYRVAGEASWRRFRTPPALGQPIDFGVVGDLGQTNDSADTMSSMMAKVADGSIDSVLFPGDLSYADGLGIRWDSYARLAEPLFSQVSTAYAGGNHEVEVEENWIAFTNRYPALFLPYDSSSSSDLFFSFKAGLAHVVTLCSYCPVHDGSPQYKWLEKDLASIDRARTPWLVLQWHTPWYTSNGHHPMSEGDDMREAMEDLIHWAGADIVFNGHVHAYERTTPIYKNQTVSCGGTVYVTIGDGGNQEGFALPWVTPQPEWSVRREFAYGHGVLRLYDAARAEWQWFQNGESHAEVSDSAVLQRNPCAAAEAAV